MVFCVQILLSCPSSKLKLAKDIITSQSKAANNSDAPLLCEAQNFILPVTKLISCLTKHVNIPEKDASVCLDACVVYSPCILFLKPPWLQVLVNPSQRFIQLMQTNSLIFSIYPRTSFPFRVSLGSFYYPARVAGPTGGEEGREDQHVWAGKIGRLDYSKMRGLLSGLKLQREHEHWTRVWHGGLK